MICRIWHGWTKPANADAYEQLLKREIFIGISARKIDGYRGIQLLRSDHDAETDEVARKALRENEDEERIRTDAIALCQKKMRTLVRRHGPEFIRTNEGRNKLTVYLLNQGYDAALARDVVKETTVVEH